MAYKSKYKGIQIDDAVGKVIEGTLQDKLTAGDGIKIEENVISADVDHSVYATKEELRRSLDDIPIEKGTGANSVAQKGGSNEASGEGSVAVGIGTTASGGGSFAEGYETTASGGYSHAEGNSTTTSNDSEHAEGKYNKSIVGKTIHTVGIGSLESDRKNAEEIHLNGDKYVYGIGGYDGTNPDNSKTVQEVINGKQEKLTEGAGISIFNNVISCTLDTTIFKVVDSLTTAPASGDENKIHLVLSSSSEEGNTYDEYLWANDSWERIGSFRPSVDLSRYAEKSYVDSQIKAEATARTKADAALKTEIENKQDNIDSFSADKKAAFLVSLGLGKIGVISQTQTWNTDRPDYTLSDIVRGFIPQSFIDSAVAAGSVYNDATGYFEANMLTDISYNEMINIMNESGSSDFNSYANICCNSIKNGRTFLYDRGTLGIGSNRSKDLSASFDGNSKIETVILNNVDITNLRYAFYSCPHLRYLKLLLNPKIAKDKNNITGFLWGVRISKMTSLFLSQLPMDLDLYMATFLSDESVLYMINNEAATSDITITLHNTVYNRCMSNADILAALQAHTHISLASA